MAIEAAKSKSILTTVTSIQGTLTESITERASEDDGSRRDKDHSNIRTRRGRLQMRQPRRHNNTKTPMVTLVWAIIALVMTTSGANQVTDAAVPFTPPPTSSATGGAALSAAVRGATVATVPVTARSLNVAGSDRDTLPVQTAATKESANRNTSTTTTPSSSMNISTQPQSESLIQRRTKLMLFWLSPRTWYGVLDFCHRSPFVNINWSDLVLGFTVLSMTVGLILIDHGWKVLMVEHRPILICLFISSSIVWFQHGLPNVRVVRKTVLHMIGTGRGIVDPAATDLLDVRVQHGLAYRRPRYDVYLPDRANLPTSNRPTHERQEQKAILFLPGALVPHEAYAGVASYLADLAGYVVVVVSMEPLRLATDWFGANVQSIKRIMNQVQHDISAIRSDNQQSSPTQDATIKTSNGIGTLEWTMMGHSMGAFAAMKLFRDFMLEKKKNMDFDMSAQQSDDNSYSSPPPVISHRLVLWGVAPFLRMSTNLTELPSDIYNHFSRGGNIRIFLVQASDDHLTKLLQADQDRLYACFPNIVQQGSDFTSRTAAETHTTVTIIRTIDGGTHDGFGSYSFPTAVTASTKSNVLSPSEQQKVACELTIDFFHQNQ